MKRLFKFFRGTVVLTMVGPFPERLINLCAQERIDFWAVSWADEHTICFTIHRRHLPALRTLAQRVNCEVTVRGSSGLPDFLLRFRRRYAFLCGLTLALCAVAVLSRFVLTIEVTGNQRLPTAVILTQLRQLGVMPGVYGPSIDRRQVAEQVTLALEDLAWMGINLHGTRLEVIVRETVQAPARIDESGYFHVVAEADGMVTRVEAELGDALVKAGDTVLAGEVLISGTVTLKAPAYSGLADQYYQTHARGRVWARTWRTITAAIPLQAQVKEYTGRKKTSWSVQVLGRRISLFGGEQGWTHVEKNIRASRAVLPGGNALPITVICQTLREYQLGQVAVNFDAAHAMLEEELERRLQTLIGDTGSVETVSYTARVVKGMLHVTLQAECQEEIGRELAGDSG